MEKTFLCNSCQNYFLAHEFVEGINEFYGLREFRLLCKNCIPGFIELNNQGQLIYLRYRIKSFFGADQYIYALCDPDTEEIRYVGRTNNPKHRFIRHLSGLSLLTKQICPLSEKSKISCDCKIHKSRNQSNSSKYWIAALMQNEKKPILQILEKVADPVKAPEREMRWIAYLIQNKQKLLNADNQISPLRKLIRKEKISFLEKPLEELQGSDFVNKYHTDLSLYGNKFSGWHHAVFINRIFNDLIITKMD